MIISSRLILKPIDLELGQRLLLGTSNEPWPSDALRSILPLYLEKLEQSNKELGFGPWVIMDKRAGFEIGDIGFKGRPNGKQEVEIGYGIIPNYRNKGFATEAVQILSKWAFNQQVKSIIATTLINNQASQQVLLKNGFKQEDVDNGLFIFRKIY